MLIDSHAHLLDERYDEDRFALIESLPMKGIGAVIECASDMDTAIRAVALAEEHAAVYAAVGVHPHDAKQWETAFSAELKTLAKRRKVVAIGEIGLDYHYDFSPREAQRRVFETQLAIAEELALPAIVHSREATADMLAVLAEHRGIRGVVHSFSGSRETMERLVELGLYIGYGGMITFKNAKKPVDAATHTPMERILVETDSPYMTPVPHRGERNSPEHVKLVAQKLAELKNMDFAEIERITTENARTLFSLE